MPAFWQLFLAVTAFGVSKIWASDSEVIELTEENFSAKVAEGEWMVEIYAPW